MSKFRITGMSAVLKRMDRVAADMEKAVAAGLYDFGAETMREAKSLTPVDYDVLRPSGYTTLPEARAEGFVVELGYGGPARSYAVDQHENMRYLHPRGGQAKFLEQPVFARIGGLSAFLTARMAPVMANGRPPPLRQAPDIPKTPWERAASVALKAALQELGIRRRAPRSAQSPYMRPLVEEAKGALVKTPGALRQAARQKGGD